VVLLRSCLSLGSLLLLVLFDTWFGFSEEIPKQSGRNTTDFRALFEWVSADSEVPFRKFKANKSK